MSEKTVHSIPEAGLLSDGELATVAGGAGAGPGEDAAGLKNVLIIDENGPDLPPEERPWKSSKVR